MKYFFSQIAIRLEPAVSTVGHKFNRWRVTNNRRRSIGLNKQAMHYNLFLESTVKECFLYNDVELLLSIQQNNKKALECLMRKYYVDLYRFSLQFTRNEDVIKNCIREVFVSLWQKRYFADKIVSLQVYIFSDIRVKLGQARDSNMTFYTPTNN